MKLRLISVLPVILFAVASCNNQLSNKSRGAIVLGDSTTIVTEEDASKIQDGIADIRLNDGNDSTGDNVAGKDTARTAMSTPVTPAGNGLAVTFKEVTIFIPGIASRETNKNQRTARGASFTLNDGNLASTSLRISGGTVSKVSQRYTTIIALQDGADKLVLDNLSATTDWEPIEVNGGAYSLSDLSPAKLQFRNVKPAEIRNAVQQAARRQKLNKKDTREWVDAVKNIRAANQAPASAVLKNVAWRIEGKDAAGKAFSKELRIDVPM